MNKIMKLLKYFNLPDINYNWLNKTINKKFPVF